MRNISCLDFVPRVRKARWKGTALLVVLSDVHVRSVCLCSGRPSVAIKLVCICSFLRSQIFNKNYAFVVGKKGGAT